MKLPWVYIVDLFKTANANWASRSFSIMLAAGLIFGWVRTHTKVIQEDCTYYKQQNNDLIAAFLHLQKMENAEIKSSPVQSSVFIQSEATARTDLFHQSRYAPEWRERLSSDTTPRQRVINRYIDSVLNKIGEDSIKRNRTKN